MKKWLFYTGRMIKKGVDILTPFVFSFLKNIYFLLLPTPVDLESCDDLELEFTELDEISSQWNTLWSRISEQCLLAGRYNPKKEKPELGATQKVAVQLRTVRQTVLSHISNDAASTQMLTCYRHAGDPAVGGQSTVCLILRFILCTSDHSHLNQVKKHSKAILPLCFFVFLFDQQLNQRKETICILFV
ncbi:hypothetical protein MD588_19760 [Photobacterium sp. SDRW27]|uniref:hypothetical protein n=1 Tax=Photobacterium obscurum TaxID=2829490 RepID=UPI002242FC4D|nr:hypothetical protein [Photobacterium obscurum]MCW8331034.1 hypothetical protein [Photobacterium obscurum]